VYVAVTCVSSYSITLTDSLGNTYSGPDLRMHNP
jgi:hypothetical protein